MEVQVQIVIFWDVSPYILDIWTNILLPSAAKRQYGANTGFYSRDIEVIGVLISPQPDSTEKKLKGRHFSSEGEVTAAAETWLDEQTSDFFSFEWLAKVRVWSLQLFSFLVGLRTYQHSGITPLSAPQAVQCRTVVSLLSNLWERVGKGSLIALFEVLFNIWLK